MALNHGIEGSQAANGLDWRERSEALSEEERRVRLWRIDQLLALGFAHADAEALAADRGVDLSAARRLVAGLGCPPDTAARVLG
jgi:hypothetical protein